MCIYGICMYLREVKAKKKTYLYLVEGAREGKKVQQKVLANLGAVDSLPTDSLLKTASKLLSYCGNYSLQSFDGYHETSRYNWGGMSVTSKLWSLYGFDYLFDKIVNKRKIKYNLGSALKTLIADRLCDPKSKYALWQNQEYYLNSSVLELHNLYRSLDELYNNHEEILKAIFRRQSKHYEDGVDIAFFDVTTFYFESIKADDLRDFGYSKDCKVNEVQVMMCMIVDKVGRPLSYELFPGNTYEGNCLKPILDKLKEKYKVNKVILVADRGICTGTNLKLVREAGYDYIMGSRIRSGKVWLKEEVLNQENYQILYQDEEDSVKGKIIKLEREVGKGKDKKILPENLVVTWSSKRAAKDKKDRERLIMRASEMLDKKKVASKRGARKYIETELGKSVLDIECIENDAKYDGYYSVATNIEINNDSMNYITDAYHQLWRIEDAFRNMKSHLETRPMFHWTPKRIRGHMLLCFIAFVFEKYLEIELKGFIKSSKLTSETKEENEVMVSANKVREALIKMECSRIKHESKEFYLRAPIEKDSLGANILDLLKIKMPAAIQVSPM